jgi:PKD repeat protein
MLLLSICALVFGLILLVGNGRANAAASGGDSRDTVSLTATTVPLNISIMSPENTTYAISEIPLTFTVNAPISWAAYSLDGGANVTTAGNATLTNLAEGSHNIVVYANNTAGNMSTSQTVYLTVEHVSIPDIVFLGTVQGLTE